MSREERFEPLGHDSTQKLRVSNFKSIRSADVEFKPLTVVVGRNSSGKSSLLQALLLAAQHLSNSYVNGDRVSLNKDLVSLGSYKEILSHGASPQDLVTLEILTPRSSWRMSIGPDIGDSGEILEKSRDSVIRSISYEDRAIDSVSELSSVTVSFDVKSDVSHSLPLALAKRYPRMEKFVVVEVANSQMTVVPIDPEQVPLMRSFEFVLFGASLDSHPIPLERVDFFHEIVERIHSAARRHSEPATATSLMAQARDSDLGVRLFEKIADVNGDEYVNHVPDDITGQIVDLLGSVKSPNPLVPQLENRVNFVLDRILQFEFATLRESPARSLQLTMGRDFMTEREIDRAILSLAQVDLVSLKQVLIPRLQESFNEPSLPVLKPIRLGVEEDLNEPETLSLFSTARTQLSRICEELYHLGPIRDVTAAERPHQNPRHLGSKGEHAVSVLEQEADTVDEFPYPPHEVDFSDAVSAANCVVKDFGSVLNSWLGHFGLARGVLADAQGRDRPIIRVQTRDNASADESVDIRSVGQGLSQLLPVLMQCLLADPGTTVIVEQPELHLHPKLEADLADFFLQCAASGRNVIVETHSEHFINRLRLRIAQDKSDHARKLVQILFAENTDGSTSIFPAELDQYGGILDGAASRWPRDFLELTVDASEDLIEAALEKRVEELEQEAAENDA